jgi:AraC family transcriptional regulator
MAEITLLEHKERINKVIDYLLKNVTGDVSLEKLASVANYSPFYLQKVFKQITGESPKQYLIRLRLESALHLIIIHPHKSILSVAIDCGFSSAAIFSRAFKNYYNTSPEKIRSLKPREKAILLKKIQPASLRKRIPVQENKKVVIKKWDKMTGIYILSSFHDTTQIQNTFRALVKMAEANELYSKDSKLYGIISPQHGHSYMAFLQIDIGLKIPSKFNTVTIKHGKYASLTTKGKVQQTMGAVHYIFKDWLPDSGYKIADEVIGFESFSEDPSKMSYSDLTRELHIPIVAK